MLYILYMNLFGKGFIGVRKKVFAQIQTFEKNFEKVFYTIYSGQMMHLLSGDTVLEKELALTWQECHSLIVKWITKYGISKTYIRYVCADRWFLQFLKEQKEKGILSVLEFPTIPYEGELSNKRVLTEDMYYRGQMSEYIEKCTTYSDFDKVFEIPCIPLVNGVDIEKHPLRRPKKSKEAIVLLAVASMAKWHGYERVIEGMAEYYRGNGEKKNIIFKLVGEGPEISRYKNLVHHYGLESHVEFWGQLEGEELNRQYDEADMAVGSLGMYKTGLEQGAPIKMREYCARGIPFLYGYKDLGFEGKEDYVMCLPNNSEKIDMQKVLEFYKRLSDDTSLIYRMREDAMRRFTWDGILKPVVEYFQEH